ncbi:MAG: hypothetical protein HY079_02325 [Elusimicrobia bacterium]|nr:hypothetical protein [Elusimicrobiota bacterium]
MNPILLALCLLAPAARAADSKTAEVLAAEKAAAEKTTVQLVEYFLKVPTSEADPKLVNPFLAVDTQTLPKKLRKKALGKQIEIRNLIKLHETKKAGSILMPLEGCSEKDFVLPLNQASFYLGLGYEEVNEDELEYVKNKTKCTEVDLGCRFTMKLFFTKSKPRRMMFIPEDPIMAIVAESRGKGGSTKFFGLGLTCMH